MIEGDTEILTLSGTLARGALGGEAEGIGVSLCGVGELRGNIG